VRVEEIDSPVPAAGQVLVRVRAAAVNRADLDGLYPRWQFIRLFSGVRRPRSRWLGLDVAGVVEDVGEGATRFKVGDQVFGDMFAYGVGAFAEYVCVPERAVEAMPAGLSFEEAATMPHSAVLAVQSLRRRNGRTPQPGQRVLIVGASGNVGPFAIQVAKALGTEVTGVCHAAKVDFVRGLGADHVIDYTLTDASRAGERYDWIVDVDARHTPRRWLAALQPKGTYVALGGSAGWMLKTLVQTPAISLATDKWAGLLLWWKPFPSADVDALKALIADGRLKPVIDRRFTLDEIVEALRWVDDGHARGKVIVTM
jgi:NADPH:quinone reductase-like Zn-dependent oxidoreductase